jgi:hypothetical protein
LVGMYITSATMEISMEVHQETKNRITIWFCYNAFGCNLKECKSTYKTDTCTSMFVAILFTR